jgi:hypothetical protein
MDDAVNQKNNMKLSKVLSTKLSIEDYNAFVILTKLEYDSGLIKEESISELLRFTIRHIPNLVHNQPEYLVLKQEQQEQKQVQNNQQQQLHNQHNSLQSTIVGHEHQIPDTYQRN